MVDGPAPSSGMMRYEKLEAWRRCHELVLAVYRASQAWPREELYGLTSQIRRATVSAATNIAEGAAKRGPREFCRYLDIATGSLSEVSYLIRLLAELGILAHDAAQELETLRTSASQLTWKLYASQRDR